MTTKEEIKSSETILEGFLSNYFVIAGMVVIFSFSFLFQLFFENLDEIFISTILRNEFLRPICDPFWLVVYWGTVAIFFLAIAVYFVFDNKRGMGLAVVAIVVLGGLFLGDALKSFFGLFGIQRPDIPINWIPDFYADFLPTRTETSDFPGQSVLVPAALSVYFYLKNPKKWKKVIFPIYVVLMMLARPYVGVNHLSANIAGTILGIYIGLLVYNYTPKVRQLEIFKSKIIKFVAAVGVFGLMIIIYTTQRPFLIEPAQGVDLDVRMFMMVLGGFIGLSLTEYPKELKFQLDSLKTKAIHISSIIICYIVLFGLYILTLILGPTLLWLGIIIGFFDGLWIAIGGPLLVEYLNKENIIQT
ncbi:MAG: phosphatase PAP2 family protein [Candidatus Lokiarchaeota archaeon]|nr:phosphatase PAP2 family protein [Candidatus Lokiarchaeota archaeon]